MQATRFIPAGAAYHPDPHIAQNRRLAREFAHDHGAVLLLALDTAVRSVALAVAGRFCRH